MSKTNTRLERRIEKLLTTPEVTMKVVKDMPYKHKEALYEVLKEKYKEKVKDILASYTFKEIR